MPQAKLRRVHVNKNGVAVSGANIIGANSTYSGSEASLGPDIRTPFVNVRNVEGYYPVGAGLVFLQFFNNVAVPADGVQPNVSIPINPAINRDFVMDLAQLPLRLPTPLSWCVSTTQKVKTLAADYVNFWLDIDEVDPLPDGLSASGNFAGGVDNIQPWTEAAGGKRIYRIEAQCNNGDPGTALYLMLFARDVANVNNFDKPFWCSPKVLPNDNSVQPFNFGKEGLMPKQLTAAGVEKYGCSVWWSTRNDQLSSPATQPGTIKLYYR